MNNILITIKWFFFILLILSCEVSEFPEYNKGNDKSIFGRYRGTATGYYVDGTDRGHLMNVYQVNDTVAGLYSVVLDSINIKLISVDTNTIRAIHPNLEFCTFIIDKKSLHLRKENAFAYTFRGSKP